MLKKIIKEKLKSFLFKYTQIGSPHYSYNLDPLQLAEIINSLENEYEPKIKRKIKINLINILKKIIFL